jgi:hypothetical protein
MPDKLFIVGNGFDLAHNLPTDYRSYFKYLVIDCLEKLTIKPIVYRKKQGDVFFATNDLISAAHHQTNEIQDLVVSISEMDTDYFFSTYAPSNITRIYDSTVPFENFYLGNQFEIFFNYEWLKILFSEIESNWVDIELSYFHQLKEIFYREIGKPDRGIVSVGKKQAIKNLVGKLNICFGYLKITLIKYLSNKVSSAKIVEDRILKIIISELEEGQIDKSNKKLIFLNFNYTQNLTPYFDYVRSQYGFDITQINIHGCLDRPDSIIFGYGDILDDSYPIIENIMIEDFLQNIKPLLYQREGNFLKLEEALNQSNEWDIIILGHSCGISDRVLLNLIFEHEKVKSIKVGHYSKDHPGKEYQDRINNIFRNFQPKNKNLAMKRIQPFNPALSM